MLSPMIATALVLLGQAQPQVVEPQPLPDGVEDSGINVLLDSSHQFGFFNHWDVQDAMRNAGHRVTGNQSSLAYALTPGSQVRVREQSDHAWGLNRPFGMMAAPEYQVLFTYQGGESQPYTDAETATLERFVEGGGGVIADCPSAASPLGRAAAELDVTHLAETAEVNVPDDQDLPGLDHLDLPTPLRVAQFSADWHVLLGTEGNVGALASLDTGAGIVVAIVDSSLLHAPDGDHDAPNAALIDYLIRLAANGGRSDIADRRVPWEPGGLGGAFYPENEIEVGGVRVLYADNQLPDIVDLAKTRFPEVMDILQRMLPTPPNPGDDYYIDLAAGLGGGWAENAVTPKLAGTIALEHEHILSILAHELAHTMYGPAAMDGTPGCGLPEWFSEAHAGWFQRKTLRELGFGEQAPHIWAALAKEDPMLDGLDLANIPESRMDLAWQKAWFLWTILDARYGQEWYPRWLEQIHNKYNDPERHLSMDEYVTSISEAVGEDLTPFFQRFGTSVTATTDLPPITHD